MTRIEITKTNPKFIEAIKAHKEEKKKHFEYLFSLITPEMIKELKNQKMGI